MTLRSVLLIPLMATLTMTACETHKVTQTDTTSRGLDTKGASSTLPAGSSKAAGLAVPTHDPAHPPIDCPLRKQGINPHDMKPFEDVEKYIAFLEREDRAQWQRPDAVVDALQLTGIETVADLGAGSGYFSFRFAKALPKGKVVAIDIEPQMIRHIHHTAMTTGVNNVEVKLAKPDNPSVPATADWVFICDVLHHVNSRAAWLKQLHDQLKSEAKVALIEFKSGDLPEGPPESLKLSKAALIDLLKTAGFELVDEKAKLLPYQTMLIFAKG